MCPWFIHSLFLHFLLGHWCVTVTISAVPMR